MPPLKKRLVTSALPYANGDIHIGHLVEYIQTDIWVRFQKMQGNTVHYVCADDTHGTPIMLMAEKENISPEQLVSHIHKEHSKDFEDFHVNFDNFYFIPIKRKIQKRNQSKHNIVNQQFGIVQTSGI